MTDRPDLAALHYSAELMIWSAGKDEEWDYTAEAAPDSAYADWVRLCSPERILALIAEVEACRERAGRMDPRLDDPYMPEQS